jgi:hypothetical protein
MLRFKVELQINFIVQNKEIMTVTKSCDPHARLGEKC